MTDGPGLWAVPLRAALDTFEELGVDVGELCRRIGLDRASLQDPDLRVPLAITQQMWPVGIELRGSSGLGLAAGAAVPFGRFEALDYAFATASSLLEGLRRFEAYYRVTTGGVTGVRVHTDDAAIRIELFGFAHPELRDYATAAVFQRIARAEVRPRAVMLAGPAVAPRADYDACFGCAVTFDAPATVLELDLEAAHAELPPQLPGLRALIDREVERLLARVDAGDPLLEVRRELLSCIGPTPPTLEDLALRLRVSPRTLQRHLAKNGATFSALVDDALRVLAEGHLAGARTTIGEVAYLLGFSEPSAFTRAFKRWTGTTPLEYRRALAGRAP